MAKKKTEERTYYAPIHKKNFFLAAIPFIIIAALWAAVILGNISTKVQKSADKVDISAHSLRVNKFGELEFDMDITNNSKYRADEVNVLISFYEDDTLIGTYSCYTSNWIKSFDASFDAKTFGQEAFDKLRYMDSEKLDIRASATEVVYWDILSMITGSDAGITLYVILGVISAVTVWIWIGKITGSRCDNCKNIFAMTSSEREVGRSAASWNTTKYLKDKDGNNVLSYDARVSGDKVTYRNTTWCKYCGKPHGSYTSSRNEEK